MTAKKINDNLAWISLFSNNVMVADALRLLLRIKFREGRFSIQFHIENCKQKQTWMERFWKSSSIIPETIPETSSSSLFQLLRNIIR